MNRFWTFTERNSDLKKLIDHWKYGDHFYHDYVNQIQKQMFYAI